MRISIITPCSRPENLEKLKASINFPCDWYIVYDSFSLPSLETALKGTNLHNIFHCNIEGGVSGNRQRNLGLSLVEDGWVYFLDDDNLIHPKFYDVISTYMMLYPEKKGWVFNQDLGKEQRWAISENIKVGKIDQAQYLLHRSIIDIQFEQKYEADGIFIEDLYKRKRDLFGSVLAPLCYYNRLRNESS